MRDRIIQQIDACFAKLPGLKVDETEIGIGYDTPRGRISVDMQRYLSVLCDLADAKVVNPSDRLKVMEIGAGYGGLGRYFVAWAPKTSYVFVDLEEMLFFAAVYLYNMVGPDRLHLVDSELRDSDLLPGHFYFVPQHRLHLISAHFDIVLNQQSMQEMTTEQVERYRSFLRDHARFFYSENMPRHGSIPGSDFLGHLNTVENVGETLRRLFSVIAWEGERNDLNEVAIYACDRTGPPTSMRKKPVAAPAAPTPAAPTPATPVAPAPAAPRRNLAQVAKRLVVRAIDAAIARADVIVGAALIATAIVLAGFYGGRYEAYPMAGGDSPISQNYIWVLDRLKGKVSRRHNSSVGPAICEAR